MEAAQEAGGPIVGHSVRFPPGRVAVRLGPEHHAAYRRLYGRYRTVLSDLPVLRDRDFDGRKVLLTRAQLKALNAALASPEGGRGNGGGDSFGTQERSRRKLFKRLQFLS